MYLRGILVKDDTKEINIKIDGNETIADLRRAIAVLHFSLLYVQKNSQCSPKRISIIVNDAEQDDSVLLQSLSLSDGDSFMYDVNLVRKPFTFEYNKRKVRININVDSSLQEIQDILIMVD